MSEKPKIELSDEMLIQQCVYGNPHSLQRTRACEELTYRCYQEIENNYPSDLKKLDELREKVIDDVQFINEEAIFEPEQAIASGQKYHPIISLPNMFDATFDEEQYVANKKKDVFPACHLALYGLERQMIQQVNEGLFQTESNAIALKNIEQVIFHYPEGVKNIPHLNSSTLEQKWLEFLDIWDEIPKIQGSPDLLMWDIKNSKAFPRINSWMAFIHTSGLVYGLDENLKDSKKWTDTLRIVIEQRFIDTGLVEPDYIEHKYNTAGKYNYNASICNMINNPKLEKDRYRICSRADGYGKQAFYIQRKSKIGNWQTASKLDCWHSFLALVSYPEALQHKWLEVQNALDVGEINEKEAERLLKEIGELEEAFQARLVEGNTPEHFTKTTEYQPLRLRLYGSQLYVNDILNKILRFLPLTEENIPNSFTFRAIEEAFDGKELRQLKENVVISDEQFQQYLDSFMNLTLDEFKEKIKPYYQNRERHELINYFKTKVLDEISMSQYEHFNDLDLLSTKIWQNPPVMWEKYMDVYAPNQEHISIQELKETDAVIIIFKGVDKWLKVLGQNTIMQDPFVGEQYLPGIPYALIDELLDKFREENNVLNPSFCFFRIEGQIEYIIYIPLGEFIEVIREYLRNQNISLSAHLKSEEYSVIKEVERILNMSDVINAANRILEEERYPDFKFNFDTYVKKEFLDQLQIRDIQYSLDDWVKEYLKD